MSLQTKQSHFYYEQPLFAVTTDIVVFTIRHQHLSVLLVNRSGTQKVEHWSLPGGFLGQHENLRQCANRQLEEQTGVKEDVYLEQLYTFGDIDENPSQRIINVAYYTLIPCERIQLNLKTTEKSVGWFAMNELPAMSPEHEKIVKKAKQRLVSKLDYSTIAFQFMKPEFTLGELQTVYQSILQEPIDKRNFRKRILALNCIEETGNVHRNGRHRPAKLFRLIDPNRVEIIK